ncbi:MAG: 50S ribosomal protein L18e [Candidatus Micrarchaeota archaeon]
MKHGTEIESLRRLIISLEKAGKKNDAAIYNRLAFMLRKPSRQRIEVNLNRINRITKDGDVIAIPGKVLGIGKNEKKVKIAAFRFSKSAIVKLQKEGIETMTLEKLLQINPTGSKVRIVI